MSAAAITTAPLDVGALMAEVADDGRGGTVVFVGSVRRGPDDGAVTAIEYSAYEAMAVQELTAILDDAEARWPGVACRAQHRVGHVPVGAPSIVVVASAPHRADAFAACRHVIEETKRRLPVWKQEFFADGTRRWREG